MRQPTTRLSSSFLTLLLFLATHSRPVGAACFYPDGTRDKNPEYVPCSTDASDPLSSICCATNRANGADICSPNGLCQVGVKKGATPGKPAWTKPSCTNEDWGEECLHVCGNDKYPFLTPCDRAAGNSSTKWCCGLTQDCCNDETDPRFQIIAVDFAGIVGDQTESRTSSSASATSSSMASPSPTSGTATSLSTTTPPSSPPSSASTTPPPPAAPALPPTSSPSPPSGLSTASKAGLAIGIALAALALLSFGAWLGRRRSRSKLRPSPASHVELPGTPPQEKPPLTVYAHYAGAGYGPHEAPGAQMDRVELEARDAGKAERAELGAGEEARKGTGMGTGNA